MTIPQQNPIEGSHLNLSDRIHTVSLEETYVGMKADFGICFASPPLTLILEDDFGIIIRDKPASPICPFCGKLWVLHK